VEEVDGWAMSMGKGTGTISGMGTGRRGCDARNLADAGGRPTPNDTLF